VIRPENIVISTEPVRTSARNQFAGRVVAVRKRGRTFAVDAEFGGVRMTSLVTPQSLEDLSIRVGSAVFFSFKASSLHLMSGGGKGHD
jgi:molybdate/tungstate transport system ATP-binding protein